MLWRRGGGNLRRLVGLHRLWLTSHAPLDAVLFVNRDDAVEVKRANLRAKAESAAKTEILQLEPG